MNYYATQREVVETMTVNDQPIRVRALWRVEEDGEQVDVYISDPARPNRSPVTLLGLDSRGLAALAEVFLTVDKMISTEAADVSALL